MNATRSGRDAAVLVLFSGESADEADLLLTVRAGTLRHHAGQAAFPGRCGSRRFRTGVDGAS